MTDDDLTLNPDEEIKLFLGSAQGLAVLLEKDYITREKIRRYAAFLLADKDDREYADLAEFLEWFGKRYLWPVIMEDVMKFIPDRIHRACEFGPGTGWLIKLLQEFRFFDAYAIDKRASLFDAEGVRFMQKDLEHRPGELFLPEPTLIIANQFLHCVDNPQEIVHAFRNQWWLVIEPTTDDDEFPYWHSQMALFGATPRTPDEIEMMFKSEGFEIAYDDTPSLWISLWKPL